MHLKWFKIVNFMLHVGFFFFNHNYQRMNEWKKTTTFFFFLREMILVYKKELKQSQWVSLPESNITLEW